MAVLDGGGREFGDDGREFGDGGRVFVKATPGHGRLADDYRFEAVVTAAPASGAAAGTPHAAAMGTVGAWERACLPRRAARLVDWGRACGGPAWADLV
ncbi:hypothetical protein [Nonomuraea sp. 10N515B]|uniref:hypothetical protein n=1 Tax=Nonomuraea sp. 10N515B TaxID=3457422 RepID=UPI003FCE74CE